MFIIISRVGAVVIKHYYYFINDTKLKNDDQTVVEKCVIV